MEFLLIAHDGTDDGALDRRLAVRDRHLALFDEFRKSGVFRYGCAILDESQQMIGSVVACEFLSRKELEDVWLSKEPYVLGDVWRTIEILQVRTRVTADFAP
jgi:hypothetical protein